jgi:hypothetical protein
MKYKFDASQQFDSVNEAIDLCKTQPDSMEALKAIVLANIDIGEFGFAADLCREAETL